MSAGLASITVFSSSSASGEKRGLLLAAIFVKLDEVAGSACRSEVAEGLRLGVHGTAMDTETVAPGDDGGGEDVRKMSAVAAVIGATELMLAPTSLSPNDERRGCIPADEGRTDTDWVGEDGGGCSTAACPRDLRRFPRFRSSALACSRAFSASLRASASTEMRGLVAVVVRAHSGTTYGFLTTAGAGAGFGVGTDAAALEIGLAGIAWPVFGGEGKAAATRALRAANKSAFCRGVCTGT